MNFWRSEADNGRSKKARYEDRLSIGIEITIHLPKEGIVGGPCVIGAWLLSAVESSEETSSFFLDEV